MQFEIGCLASGLFRLKGGRGAGNRTNSFITWNSQAVKRFPLYICPWGVLELFVAVAFLEGRNLELTSTLFMSI